MYALPENATLEQRIAWHKDNRRAILAVKHWRDIPELCAEMKSMNATLRKLERIANLPPATPDPGAAVRLSTDCIAVDNFPEPQPRLLRHSGILPTLQCPYRGDTDWRDQSCEAGYNAEDHVRHYDEATDTERVTHGDGSECMDREFIKSV